MRKYWIVPAVAVAAISFSMIYFIANIEKPLMAPGKAVFVDGTIISDVIFEPAVPEDKHKLVIMKVTKGKESGLAFAIHLNDQKQQIAVNVGDFDLLKYCIGDDVLTCSMPLPRDGFNNSKSMGIAAYKTPDQLLELKEGRSDWNSHRALFSTVSP